LPATPRPTMQVASTLQYSGRLLSQ
jgi:hypothetical protein